MCWVQQAAGRQDKNANTCIFIARQRPGWAWSREQAAWLNERLASDHAAQVPLAAHVTLPCDEILSNLLLLKALMQGRYQV